MFLVLRRSLLFVVFVSFFILGGLGFDWLFFGSVGIILLFVILVVLILLLLGRVEIEREGKGRERE